MKIKSFEVFGMLGRDSPIRLDFNDDLNVITGRNGSGKTSVLKLLWYIMSGNIVLGLKEVPFKKATLETSDYTCTVYRSGQLTCRIEWHDSAGSVTYEDAIDEHGDIIVNAEDRANEKIMTIGSSVFFPTFRRIEGGFTLSDQKTQMSRARFDIDESLASLSKRLSHENHIFVAALSTSDVVNLLVRQYTDLSEVYNKQQAQTSQEVISDIKDYKRKSLTNDNSSDADRLLDEIIKRIEGAEEEREHIMRPLDAVTSLTMKLFRHSGIKLGRHLSFGEAAGAVNSDSLSAGEKQMLSFIAYNAFYKDAVVIIDEPELSLHVDWQRQLFPVLLDQQTSNQFVIATHSPFIFGKYPDKELLIDNYRGNEEA